MRKLKYSLLAALVLMSYSITKSQGDQVQDPNFVYKTLEKKVSKSDEDIQNPKKQASSSTWTKRGDMMVEVYNVDQEFLGIGLSLDQLKIFYRNLTQQPDEEVDGKTMTVYGGERIKVFVQNSKVKDWEILKMATEEPLLKAYEAYAKAIELDESGKVATKIDANLDVLKEKCEREASMQFMRKNYEASAKYFDCAVKSYALKTGEGVTVDTSNIYNAGLAASNANNYKLAIEYFIKAKEYNYGEGDVYLLLKKAYSEVGDSLKILPLLQEGFEKHPKNKDIIVNLINYYLNKGQSKEALEYLRIAKEQEPSNANYYFAEGTLYDKMGEQDKTIEAYKTAIELDPEFYDPYYNMGVIYYNRMVEIVKKADSLPPSKNKEFNELMKQGYDELKLALPYLEKALELAEKYMNENPGNPDYKKLLKETLDTCKTTYFRLRNEDPKYQQRHDEIKAMLDQQ